MCLRPVSRFDASMALSVLPNPSTRLARMGVPLGIAPAE